MKNSGYRLGSINLSKTFGQKEYAEIEGEGKRSFYILTALIFSSLFALTLAKGSLDYLEVKMNSPFTNWLTVEMSNASNYDKYNEVNQTFETWARSGRFGIDSKTGTYKSLWEFYKMNGDGLSTGFTRSFSYFSDSLLLQGILEESNVVKQYTKEPWPGLREMKDGIIITESFLNELGSQSTGQGAAGEIANKKLLVEYGFAYAVNILAVVKSLPQQGEIFCEHTLLRGIEDGVTDRNTSLRVFNVDETSSLNCFLFAEDEFELNLEEFKREFNQDLTEVALLRQNEILEITIEKNDENLGFNYRVAVELRDKESDVYSLFREINRKLPDFNSIAKFGVGNCVLDIREEYPSPIHDIQLDKTNYRAQSFSSLSVKFNELDSIDFFQNELEREHQVEIDMDQVISRNNFYLISLISKLLVVIIVLLSVFAVTFYLYNMVSSHLEKIKSNLGTLLAFGVPKKFLQKVYMGIVFKLLFKSIAFTLISLLAIQALVYVFPSNQDMIYGKVMAYYSILNNVWLYGAILILSLVTYIFFKQTLKNFLEVSPGDLIYNR